MRTNYQRLHEKEYDKLMKKIDNVCSEVKILKEIIKSERKEAAAEINSLKDENRKLKKEVSRLKNQINKDSSNSSKPPSSNGFREVVQNNRLITDKKVGGQVGHKGTTVKPVENPDEIIEYKKELCDCGHKLDNVLYTSKQEMVLKVIQEVIQYNFFEGRCSKCNKVHKVVLPDGLKNPMNYGASVKSFVAFLNNQGLVSINRTSEFLELISDGLIKVSNGTIVNWNKELATKLKPTIDNIKSKLLNSDVLNVDESPIKVNGKQNFVHSASTDEYTLQLPHEKKGLDAINEIDILPNYFGVLVHDHFKAYYRFGIGNAECNVHIARYLKNIIDITDHKWAKELLDFLYHIKDQKKLKIDNNINNFSEDEIDDIFNKYNRIIKTGNAEYKLAIHKEDDERKLLKRLDEYKENHLMFIKNFKVPFSNNQAERDLRGVKTKQKIGKFRSFEGAKVYCTIKSIESTLKKKNQNFFKGILDAFNNKEVII